MGQKHVMARMNRSGDTTVEWDPANEGEVAAARATWDSLVGGKRFSAFGINEDGSAGARLRAFDPQQKKIILVPPLQGGA